MKEKLIFLSIVIIFLVGLFLTLTQLYVNIEVDTKLASYIYLGVSGVIFILLHFQKDISNTLRYFHIIFLFFIMFCGVILSLISLYSLKSHTLETPIIDTTASAIFFFGAILPLNHIMLLLNKNA